MKSDAMRRGRAMSRKGRPEGESAPKRVARRLVS
jgi:hypothetical protein